jgi:hypothetical protein
MRRDIRSRRRIHRPHPQQNGPGFNLQLRALPLDGRIVLLPPDTDDKTACDAKSR